MGAAGNFGCSRGLDQGDNQSWSLLEQLGQHRAMLPSSAPSNVTKLETFMEGSMSHQWKVEHKYPEFLSEEEVSSEAATTNGHSIPYLEVRGLEAINKFITIICLN